MKNDEIIRRIDEALNALPKNEVDVQILKRYAGTEELVSVFSRGIVMLQKLRAELST